MTELESTVTAQEASEILGVTKNRVLRMVRDGVLPAVKVGNMYLVDREAVERRRDDPPRAGNPNFGKGKYKRPRLKPPDGWMTVDEAAAAIGVTRTRVGELAKLGRLESRRVGDGAKPRVIVSAESVARHIEEGPRKPGRKPKTTE